MYFLVYERRKGTDEPIDDLGGLMNGLTEWLSYLQQLKKKGTLVQHWGFHGHHGSVSIYDVASGQELEEILRRNPMDERWVHREVFQACTIEQELENVFKYMTGV